MKKLILFVTVIIIFASCTYIMEEKVSTKGYEEFKKELNDIDTLQIKEKEYIAIKAREMIVEVGNKEAECAIMGLKVDTSELLTFREFYSNSSGNWRLVNYLNNKKIASNIAIENAIVKVKIISMNAEISDINSIRYQLYLKSSDWGKFEWKCLYEVIYSGTAIVHHNLEGLEGFQPEYYNGGAYRIGKVAFGNLSQEKRVDLKDKFYTFYGMPLFTKDNDSIYTFKYISGGATAYEENNYKKSGISYSDWNYYCKNDYFPDRIIKEDTVLQNRILEEQKSFYTLDTLTLWLREVYLEDGYLTEQQEVEIEYLNDNDYKELISAEDNSLDDATMRRIKSKYGLIISL